ncbi:MAG: sulfatase-like hydrolase/transferase, partial [Kofleriaceae bacterium]
MRSAFVHSTVRIIAVWAVLLSIENAISSIVRPASAYRLADWFKGQLLGVPVALALLAPAAIVLVLVARQIAARRALLIGTGAALTAIGVAYALSTGPAMVALERRIPFVIGAGALAFGLALLFTRNFPLDRPRLLAAFGGGVAVAAWLADQRVLPGLYPALHISLVVIALAASATISLVLPAHRAPSARSLVLWRAGFAIAAVWMITSLVWLSRDEHVRWALLEDAPVLGRVTFLSTQLPFVGAPSWDEPTTDSEPDLEISRIVRAPELPRTLDWSTCDVLLVTVDALRADHLGSYGYDRPTSPAIDRLAARGARFDRAYSLAPKTSYALASLMAGKNMRVLHAATRNGMTTWADHMRNLGYETTSIYSPVVFLGALLGREFGFDRHSKRGANTSELYDELSGYLARAPKDKPVFVWTHVFEPHEPYEMRPEHPFSGDRDIDAYDSEIAAADAYIGKAVALIESRSRCSVIIVTADHGEAFGEHGARFHGNHVYEEQVRVPLVVVAPGVVPGVIERPVQTIDLLPTMLSAMGQRRPAGISGRDLGHLLKGDPLDSHPGVAFAETPRYSMTAVGTERLICDRDASTCALYDLATDPKQHAAIRDRPQRVEFLRRLTAVLSRGDEPAPSFPMRVAAAKLRFVRTIASVEGDKLVANGQPGPVVYGPYTSLPAGTYELAWIGSGMSSPGEIAFRVTADWGQALFAESIFVAKNIPVGPGEMVRLPFAVDRLRYDVQFVVESRNGGRVVLDHLVVSRTAEEPRGTVASFPWHEAATSPLLRRGHVVVESDSLVATGEGGVLVYGPYAQLSAGAYELRWDGRGIDSPGQVAFRVTADAGREVFAQTTVTANELPREPSELTRIPFVLDRHRSQIEFLVETSAKARLVLSKLVVEKTADDPLAAAPRFPLVIAAASTKLEHANANVEANKLVATGAPGTVVFGPYMQLPKGRYELRWLGSRI